MPKTYTYRYGDVIFMQKYMIDTNIFDSLVADPLFPDIYQMLGKEFVFVTTPIQEEEIEKLDDPRRKTLLQAIPRQVVPLVPLPDDLADTKHTNDRHIAKTTARVEAILVTNDRTLQEWCNQHMISTTLSYDDFITSILPLLDNPPC